MISVDFPLPETPVTQTKQFNGISAFTFLSQHWYCLQQQGAKRLEQLAPNGILPVHDQSIIINQASFILMKQYMKKNAVTIVNIHTDDQIYISNIKSKKQKRNQRGLDECCEKDSIYEEPDIGKSAEF